MQLKAHHLSYCTNVHPAETFAELISTLESHVIAVKSKVSPQHPFGVGLRLSAKMILSMDEPQLHQLIQTLNTNHLYVFSVNGFPYGDFNTGVVKTDVYSPGWHDRRRVEYTKRIADVLCELPGPLRRTISTVALGYKPTYDDGDILDKAVRNLRETMSYLEEKKAQSGVHIELCLEPEPGTYLERSEDVISFFSTHGFNNPCARNEHLSLCYDTCHQAVMFENAVSSMRALREAGVRIGKMQISNAIILNRPSSEIHRSALQSFSEPRFLHQVVGNKDDLFALDLSDVATPSSTWTNADEWRCHFHVPLHWQGNEYLNATTQDWQAALKFAVETELCTHYEIETYTWHVLPPDEFDASNIATCVTAEFEAVLPYFLSN